ncbi:hypothetical protein IW140_003955 [Coemansia sp. RSA 1813]|nr:hypothetical protein EV178_003870 [Coemansia sp. RSA 1646]KAJ1769879.1 hypothetical protein LPJ74_003668 [Coemansia sp. RSA 1843]KAJ2088541.1 hypothetical protein IW138_004130 [Coemansia sp. RSA 986]KAJ2213423.1 hypothetical protein EV179_003841 [Coemansia sp. RSA 487]KAJ2568318.1 hypothetical protein IW140_003955 [Coemansia sp. RSA 1813]
MGDSKQFRPLEFLKSWALERRCRHLGSAVLLPPEDKEAFPAFGRLQSFADFVISFKYIPLGSHTEGRQAMGADVGNALEGLVKRLSHAGLEVEVREALKAASARRRGASAGAASFTVEPGHLLLFVRCPRDRLLHEVGRSRLSDWLGGMLPLRRVRSDSGVQGADPLEVDPETQDDPSKLLEVEDDAAERMSPAERQRVVHRLIVGPESEGCAGVNAEREAFVWAVFPLHNQSFNRSWIRHWSSKWLIDRHDLRRIRENFGEEVAMYFAFLQSYFLWLTLPAAVGLAWWVAGWSFSWQFGVLLVLWSVVFTETWARRESDIATYWGVHGVERAASLRRPDFRPDYHVADPATGEMIPVFSNGKRWLRRLLGVPVVLALALVMALLVSLIFALQTFLGEYYDGPFQTVLGFTPIVLFSACLPVYTSACTRIAKLLTDYENYEHESEYAAQYTTKIFVFQFLQDQLYLFLTAWVFVPNRDGFERWVHGIYDSARTLPPWMVSFLADEGKSAMGGPSASNYAGIKSSSTPATVMVQSLLTSFVVTSQIVNLMTETAVPLLLRWWNLRSLRKASDTHGAKESSPVSPATDSIDPSTSTSPQPADVARTTEHRPHSLLVGNSTGVERWADAVSSADDAVAPVDIQMQFAAQVTEETQLPAYTTYEDYAEMASQFGRVAFFSVAWPLAPLAAFINNWLELRTDAAKICGATKRPIPRRVDTIGPWLDMLRFMCWLSSITNALLIYQFHPDCSFLPAVADAGTMQRIGRTNLSFALVVLLFSEHMFLAIRWAITHVMASWPGAHARIVGRSQAQSKRRWLERTPAALRDLVGAGDEAHDTLAAEDKTAPRWHVELEYGLQTIHDAFKTE